LAAQTQYNIFNTVLHSASINGFFDIAGTNSLWSGVNGIGGKGILFSDSETGKILTELTFEKASAADSSCILYSGSQNVLIFSIKITTVVFADGIRESWWQIRKTALAKKRVSFANCSQNVPSARTLAVPQAEMGPTCVLYENVTQSGRPHYLNHLSVESRSRTEILHNKAKLPRTKLSHSTHLCCWPEYGMCCQYALN